MLRLCFKGRVNYQFSNCIRRRSSFQDLVAGSLEVIQTPDPNKKAITARRVYNDWIKNKGNGNEILQQENYKISDLQAQLPLEPEAANFLKFATHMEMGSHKQRKEL